MPAVRGPIRSAAMPPLGMRPPIQSIRRTPEQTKTTPPHTETVSAPPAPPPPPPPPLLSSSPASPHSWSKKEEPPTPSPPSSKSPRMFGGGRKIPGSSDNTSHTPQFPVQANNSLSSSQERVFPKPSEMKTNRTGFPVPGKFVGRQNPPSPRAHEEEEERTSKPIVSGKPLSVMERIKLLKKPAGDEGGSSDEKSGPPPRPPDGFSPQSGRRMKKESSVSDLIKTYHSNGNSNGEKRTTSPEQKPFLPPKPAGVSPKHVTNEKSPHLKRRPIGQQNAPPPALPDRTDQSLGESSPARQVPHWRKTPAQEQEPVRPVQQREEQPVWKRGGEEADSQPSWKKAAEEREQPKPPQRWKRKEEESRAVPTLKQREENRPELPTPPTPSPPTPPEPGRESSGPSRPSFTYKSATLLCLVSLHTYMYTHTQTIQVK